MIMEYCENLRIVENGNYIILNNPENGCWIKLTKESFCHIDNYIKDNLKLEDFLNKFEKSSAFYIQNILERLKKLGIVDYISICCMEEVDFSITSRCNLKCNHCANSIFEGNEELSKKDILSTFDKLAMCGIKRINITGGEPLVRDDFNEISIYAKHKFDKLYLMSNATLINEKNVEFIVDTYAGISISLDGYDSVTCEKIRGVGVFERVQKAVELLKENGMKDISISSVSNAYNINKDEKFIKLNKKWGTEPILRRYAPVGRGEINSVELFKPMLDVYCQEDITVEDTKEELNWGDSFENGTTVCGAYKKSMYIGSDLCIYPCGALNLPEFKGDCMKDIVDMQTYMREKKYKDTPGYAKYDSIRPENAPYCKGCSVYMFCNDCPAYLYLYHKHGYLSDYCKINKKMLEGEIYG